MADFFFNPWTVRIKKDCIAEAYDETKIGFSLHKGTILVVGKTPAVTLVKCPECGRRHTHFLYFRCVGESYSLRYCQVKILE
jgi:hypothetical protein